MGLNVVAERPDESGAAALRRDVLVGLGAGASDVEALLAYNRNVFAPTPELLRHGLPLPDEPHVEAWVSYVSRAGAEGVLPVLRQALVQLCFPVRAGIADTDAYRAATRRGEWPPASIRGIELEQPGGVAIHLQGTLAGRIPVIVTTARADFEALVRALTARNEPVPVPAAVGAYMVAGYLNWERIARFAHQRAIAQAFMQPHAGSETEAGTPARDRFIIACAGPYSGVQAQALGLDATRWRNLSLQIRIGHECLHYYTRRALGSMRNRVLDELIADYAGISAGLGHFRADWFLRFLGLEDYPRYRPGGRLDAYRGDPPLSDRAFSVLQTLTVEAAVALEALDRELAAHGARGRQNRVIRALTCLTLEELASKQGTACLRAALPET